MLDALTLIKKMANTTRGLTFIAVGIGAVILLWQPFVIAQGPGGGPNAPDVELVERFDADSNGYLDAEERDAARNELGSRNNRGGGLGGLFGGGPGRRGGGPPGFGGGPPGFGGGRGGGNQSGTKGITLTPDKVDQYGEEDLYDQSVLRTFFLNFAMDNWESELETFKPTDVEIPCRVEVDGKVYPNVGCQLSRCKFILLDSNRQQAFVQLVNGLHR